MNAYVQEANEEAERRKRHRHWCAGCECLTKSHTYCPDCIKKFRIDKAAGLYVVQWTRRSGEYPQRDFVTIENNLIWIVGDYLPIDPKVFKNWVGPFQIEDVEKLCAHIWHKGGYCEKCEISIIQIDEIGQIARNLGASAGREFEKAKFKMVKGRDDES